MLLVECRLKEGINFYLKRSKFWKNQPKRNISNYLLDTINNRYQGGVIICSKKKEIK